MANAWNKIRSLQLGDFTKMRVGWILWSLTAGASGSQTSAARRSGKGVGGLIPFAMRFPRPICEASRLRTLERGGKLDKLPSAHVSVLVQPRS